MPLSALRWFELAYLKAPVIRGLVRLKLLYGTKHKEKAKVSAAKYL